jgi:hypothetical protein
MFGGFVLTHGAAAAPHRLWHSAGRRLVNGGRFHLAAIARFWLAAMNLPPSYRVARQIDLAIWLVLFVLSKFFLQANETASKQTHKRAMPFNPRRLTGERAWIIRLQSGGG